MENRVDAMTFRQLKKIIKDMEQNSAISDETKVFIDTGWDSVQEVEPKSILVDNVLEFKVEDELTKEFYYGYTLEEKANKVQTIGNKEIAIIIKNLY